ncbi:hypothetical protein [Achromobacter sp. NFACC18-2]|uniref:hypothetical protein n=1 Tax=Achromobacter sp. NFACC18-2 TaxID=1564112 RepID=UPI0008AEDCE3|nr:hypothetical protein [Achromobacter sp. NFACC18-2]SEI93877.1 hypothetical protein SAMN03159494_01370 [Achromobacter sp. NFACC18-2]
MNTADISVLQDELAVSLNPLRRGSNRARAFCARLSGLAMPWGATASSPRSSAARWPFPPAPTPDEASTAMPTRAPAPAIAPSAPVAPTATARDHSPSAPAASAATARDHSIGDAKVQPAANQLTMKAMVTDVLLVLAWGAMIPGLMWLGVAGGF